MKYYECIRSYTDKEIGEIYSEEDKPIWFKNYNNVRHFIKESPHSKSFFKETDKIKKEVIPEYVECIKTRGVYKLTLNKIYPIINLDDSKLTINDDEGLKIKINNVCNDESLSNKDTDFKLSTKEAFDLQNKPKQLTVDDLIKGGIYVLDINKNKDFISKFDCIESDNYYDCCFIHKNKFENDPDSLTISEIRNIRLATNEEKKWLNTCITQDKFISKSDLHLYDESGLLIKKEEAMFKKNDYIVVLYNDNSLNSWTNQCFKQLEDLYYLKVVKNLNGNTDGWSVINFENQSKWRYASSAEILEYERIGKPFDVTTLIKKEKSLVKQVEQGLKLKGRWLKCIENCDWNSIVVGEYIQILQNNNLVPDVKWADNEKDYCLDLGRVDRKEFELMPEDFSPNEEKEWIPKVGDWIVITQDVGEKGMIFKIKSQFDDIVGIWRLENSQYSYSNDQIRKATEEEIEQVINKKEEWIPIISNCIMYNGEDISKSFEVSQYYEFDGKSFYQDIYIPSITKKTKQLQTITIESTIDLNLNLTKIKSKQIQTIKI